MMINQTPVIVKKTKQLVDGSIVQNKLNVGWSNRKLSV